MKLLRLIILTALGISQIMLLQAQEDAKKLDLRVLYVGGTTNWENEAFKNEEEKTKDIAARKYSFEQMLKGYFTKVDVIDATDYVQSLSDNYDVTVMDGIPKAISPSSQVKDVSGRVTKIIPAGYLTEDFDRPMLFIGNVGESMGRSIGLKVDWYCLCLDSYAHSYKSEHKIFKGPFKVQLNEEMRNTPEEAFHYEYFFGSRTPEQLKMWQVQTKGYLTHPNFRIGLVARPWGFEDSPDAESISSGVCQKTLDAVALGRHGNFFHWGFAASPEYLTDEAKDVLANAVVYIAQYNGKGIIARKYLDRRATKEYLKERKYYATKEAYAGSLKSNKEFEVKMLAIKKTAEEKQQKGESLDAMESRVLHYTPQPEMSYVDFLKRHQGEALFAQFGVDEKAYIAYYDTNYDYFYSEDASYVIAIDEDVKSLGIPNTEHRLLDKCISMLESGQNAEKATRILHRYTLLNFATASQWRNWYAKNKDKLFFTQTGGFYFMVNTSDKTEPANNYKAKDVPVVSYEKIKVADTDHNSPVSVAAGVVDLEDGRKEVVVKMKIHPGYHIYAHVEGNDPYIKTEVAIKLPSGLKAIGDLQLPSFKYFNDKGTTIFEDEVIFRQIVSGEGSGIAEITYTYQCCDSQICFPPEEKAIRLEI